MHLEERDGNLCFIKKDGTPSSIPVTDADRLKHYGFFLMGESHRIVSGNPKTGVLLLVEVRMSRRHGNFLIRRGSESYTLVHRDDLPYAEELVKNPPKADTSLDMLIHEHAEARRDAVDIDALAAIRGLRVFEAFDFDGYWCKESGDFKDIPEGWTFLPKGDAGLTRRVRKGPHWVLMQRKKVGKKFFSEQVGTIVPGPVVEEEFERLGGEAGRMERDAAKDAALRKRLDSLEQRLRAAILAQFPGIPKRDLEETLRHASRSGAVGRGAFLFSASYGEQGEGEFDQAAYLAVRAHARHAHTNYDEILCSPGEDEIPVSQAMARHRVAPDIEDILRQWRHGGR